VARVSEVACRAYHILNYVVVSKVSRYEVDWLTQFIVTEAVRDIRNTHVWTSYRQVVSYFAFDRASFKDVPSKQRPLGQAENVELSLEVFIGQDCVASHMRLVFEISEDWCLRTISHLDTVCICASLILDLFRKIVHPRVDTLVSESMEDGGRDSFGIRYCNECRNYEVLHN
jgi:hypothetical protein